MFGVVLVVEKEAAVGLSGVVLAVGDGLVARPHKKLLKNLPSLWLQFSPTSDQV